MTEPSPDFTLPKTPVGTDGVADFSVSDEPIEFRCDGRMFYAPRTVAPVNLQKLARVAGSLQGNDADWFVEHLEESLPAVAGIFEAFVPGPDGKYLASRVTADGSDPALQPLDLIKQGMPILFYLMEQLGLRPTQPSSPSSGGLTGTAPDTSNDDTSSTAGASAEG